MISAKKRYRLTAEAAQDLLNIARYTVKTWGVAQSSSGVPVLCHFKD